MDYLAGFFDGEGSFVLRFIPDKRYKSGFQIRPHINITQKNYDILEKIKQELKMGYIYFHKRDKLWYFNVYNLQDISKFISLIKEKVFVKKDRLVKFEQCIKMMLNKNHLTPESAEKMKMIWLTPKTEFNAP